MRKRRREERQPIACIVTGLYAEGKHAVAHCLLRELQSATVIGSDLKAAQSAVPTKADKFEVSEYTTETPQLTPQQMVENVVVLAHELAWPCRVAAALASGSQSQA